MSLFEGFFVEVVSPIVKRFLGGIWNLVRRPLLKLSEFTTRRLRERNAYISKEEVEIQIDKIELSAKSRLQKAFRENTTRVMEIRRRFGGRDSEKLTIVIAEDQSLPENVRTQFGQFQASVRAVIEETATRIENVISTPIVDTLNRRPLNRDQRTDAIRLVDADKSIRVSSRSLRMVMEEFSNINENILSRIKDHQDGVGVKNDRARELELLLGNAFLVYELTDFVIRYLETFKISGMDDVTKLHHESIKRVNEIRVNNTRLRTQAMSERNEDVKKRVLQSVDDNEFALSEVVRAWDEYKRRIEELSREASEQSKMVIASLRLLRSNSQVRIDLMELLTIVHMAQDRLQDIEVAVTTLEKMQLAPLPPDQITRLLGLDNPTSLLGGDTVSPPSND